MIFLIFFLYCLFICSLLLLFVSSSSLQVLKMCFKECSHHILQSSSHLYSTLSPIIHVFVSLFVLFSSSPQHPDVVSYLVGSVVLSPNLTYSFLHIFLSSSHLYTTFSPIIHVFVSLFVLFSSSPQHPDVVSYLVGSVVLESGDVHTVDALAELGGWESVNVWEWI